MSIGEKLKDLRLSAKRTLKQQSEIFGVTLNTVYRWEHDLTKPRKPTLMQIAGFYDVTVEYLSDKDSKEKPKSKQTPEIEQQLLMMFQKLPVDKKYKVLGYVERIFLEHTVPNV